MWVSKAKLWLFTPTFTFWIGKLTLLMVSASNFGATQVQLYAIQKLTNLSIACTSKKIAQKFVPAEYTLKLGFAQVTCFTILSPILGVWPPYLGAGLECICLNFLHTNLIHWASKKSMSHRFSASWKHNPKIWGCVRNAKIGLTSFFSMPNTQT